MKRSIMLLIRIFVFIVLAVLPNFHCTVYEKEFEAMKEEVQKLRTMFQAFHVQLLSSYSKFSQFIQS